MPATRSRRTVDSDVPKPRSDAYVGLLGLSLLALTAAMLFAYLNWSAVAEKPPKAVQVAPKAGGAVMPPGGPAVPPPGGAPAPPAPPGAQPPVPPPGGQPRAPQPKQ